MKIGYLDDFGGLSNPLEVEEGELERRNSFIENMGLEEYGMWIEVEED
jgi:hypothetical protein